MKFEPRRWWDCPLDVERLAMWSVRDARDSAQALATRRRMNVQLATTPELVAASFAAIEHLRIDGHAAAGWAPMSGFFQTSDGWVRLHANYPHHAGAITRALRVSTRDELTVTLPDKTAQEVEDAVTAEGGIAVAVRTPQEWLTHPHGAVTANDPWVSVQAGGDRPALPTASPTVLAGVRVLDLTRVIAGPTCSQLLACLGADVLRIDPPGRPELLDHHQSTGMGKRSAVADLDADPGALEELLPTADVVLLGYRPGALSRYGLDPDGLLDRHPHLVVASLSAWGEHGPWGQRPGFDSIVQAATGIATESGHPDRPGALPVQALDHSTGYVMAAEVMRLLAGARAGIIRVSLLGAARTLLAYRRPPVVATVDLTVRTVEVPSPHGRLTIPPPPLTIDGDSLEQPVNGYAGSRATWVSAAKH